MGQKVRPLLLDLVGVDKDLLALPLGQLHPFEPRERALARLELVALDDRLGVAHCDEGEEQAPRAAVEVVRPRGVPRKVPAAAKGVQPVGLERRRAEARGLALAPQHALLTLDEVLAIRLYTGPAYQPINSFLRQIARLSAEARTAERAIELSTVSV